MSKDREFRSCEHTHFDHLLRSREHSTKNFQKHPSMSLKLTRTEGACLSFRNTGFPGKLKGVLHSQEEGTNVFPSQLHNMSVFKDCPKFCKKFCRFAAIMTI